MKFLLPPADAVAQIICCAQGHLLSRCLAGRQARICDIYFLSKQCSACCLNLSVIDVMSCMPGFRDMSMDFNAKRRVSDSRQRQALSASSVLSTDAKPCATGSSRRGARRAPAAGSPLPPRRPPAASPAWPASLAPAARPPRRRCLVCSAPHCMACQRSLVFSPMAGTHIRVECHVTCWPASERAASGRAWWLGGADMHLHMGLPPSHDLRMASLSDIG